MKTVGAFLLFLVLAIAWTWPARGWPMVFDDLHLVRTFSGTELAAAWTGHWDPDGLETPGFRPLSLEFNHVRAAVFDDHVIGHRHLLAGMFALVLALLVPLGRSLGLGFAASVAAGLVMLFTRYSAYHLVWITDGNHHLQGLAFAGSALLLVPGLARSSRAWLAASLLAIALGLCVREDTLAALPALALIAFARGPRRLAATYTIGLGTLGVGMLAWRRAFVPAAQPLGLDFAGFARAVLHAFDPVGVGGFDTASRVLSHGWWLLLAVTLGALVATRDRAAQRDAAGWALVAAFACTPGLLLQRDDLLFFASLFVALMLATAWQAIWRTRPSWRPLVVIGLAWSVVGGGWTGARLAENFHPASARAVDWNTEFLYGRYASARIPEERRRRLVAQLDTLGIRAGEQPRLRVRALIAEAREAGRRRPTADGRVFFPLLPEPYF
ncbi:MAG TPA: hypothetical protein VFT38_01935 [Vicinamibacteria bacterium]|nr:hypothetical protein [Vicinamibacteria bacterium]